MEEMSKSELVKMFGSDAYMFLQSVEKYEKNLELEKELKKIEISQRYINEFMRRS